jgi:tetrahydromethanopterin S-methyltransferase subunit G
MRDTNGTECLDIEDDVRPLGIFYGLAIGLALSALIGGLVFSILWAVFA